MKKTIFILACLSLSLLSKSQANPDEVALLQANYGLEKRQIVTKMMKLTEAEEKGFWQMYDAYELERKAIGKKRVDNLKEYADHYDNLTDDKVKELLNNSLAVQTDFAALWKKTFASASKVMSPLRAGLFIQLEMYLENVVRLEITEDIPMIGELEKSHKK